MLNTDDLVRYNINIHSPLGIKHGELLIRNDKGKFHGNLYVLNSECEIYDVSACDTNFEFSCVIKTIIGEINCEVYFIDKDGQLYGMVKTNKGCMAVTGNRIRDY